MANETTCYEAMGGSLGFGMTSACDCTCSGQGAGESGEVPLHSTEWDSIYPDSVGGTGMCCARTCSLHCFPQSVAGGSSTTKRGSLVTTTNTPPSKRRLGAGSMGFRRQSGQGATNDMFAAGQEAARAAYEAGGVNALLAFLAGFEG
jgi:hypothetical protein